MRQVLDLNHANVACTASRLQRKLLHNRLHSFEGACKYVKGDWEISLSFVVAQFEIILQVTNFISFPKYLLWKLKRSFLQKIGCTEKGGPINSSAQMFGWIPKICIWPDSKTTRKLPVVKYYYFAGNCENDHLKCKPHLVGLLGFTNSTQLQR